MYGGVPLELHEVLGAKTDYVRSTREETLEQAKEDVKFAAENLPDIVDVKDGEISSPAAYHLLSEIYLALGMNEEAKNAATEVIDNQALGLMKIALDQELRKLLEMYIGIYSVEIIKIGVLAIRKEFGLYSLKQIFQVEVVLLLI